MSVAILGWTAECCLLIAIFSKILGRHRPNPWHYIVFYSLTPARLFVGQKQETLRVSSGLALSNPGKSFWKRDSGGTMETH